MFVAFFSLEYSFHGNHLSRLRNPMLLFNLVLIHGGQQLRLIHFKSLTLSLGPGTCPVLDNADDLNVNLSCCV